MSHIPKNILKLIDKQRESIKRDEPIRQKEIDRVIHEISPYKHLLLEGEKEEILQAADTNGKPQPVAAPRWVCHLLGLRHRCVHILLQWSSPMLSTVYVLQMRSWDKFDEPAHLDMSVSGHVVGEHTAEEAVISELNEELGLTVNDLEEPELTWVMAYEKFDQRPEKNFYNLEWRDVFKAKISTAALDKIFFTDREVVGLYLCPAREIKHLLQQNRIPLASGLRSTLSLF